MEQKVIPIILNGKDSVERMKEITDRLETGIQPVSYTHLDVYKRQR